MDKPEQANPEVEPPSTSAKATADKSTADYKNWRPPNKQRSPKFGKLGKRLVVLGVIILIGAGGYLLVTNLKSDKKPAESAKTAENSQPAAASITTTTKHYDSTDFNLQFDYPADWTVAEDANKGQIITTSPAITLTDSINQKATGQIVMSIRNGTQKFPEFDAGNATATRDSQKLAYSNPTQSQRGSTYLSLLRYASSAAGLSGVYITGDFGYTKNQAIPKVDIVKIDPSISITFVKCTSSDCSGAGTQLSIAESAWDQADFSTPLTNMLKSLSIV